MFRQPGYHGMQPVSYPVSPFSDADSDLTYAGAKEPDERRQTLEATVAAN